MKKAIKILTLLLALALVVSTLAIAVFATDDCEQEETNVAPLATVTGDRGPGTTAADVLWHQSMFWKNANDGDRLTVSPANMIHKEHNYGLWLNFDTPYKFTKIVLQTYGVGRAEEDYTISQWISGNTSEYDIQVTLYDAEGAAITTRTVTAGGTEDLVIELDENIERASQIYIFFEHPVARQPQAIWEVYAYTTEAHDWEDVEETIPATCTENGKKVVMCADCQEEAEVATYATGHKNSCTGVCANEDCEETVTVEHVKPTDGSLDCANPDCGATDVFTACSHAEDALNPCTGVCVLCGESGVVPIEHLSDGSTCNNDCIKCGAENVIPTMYDLAVQGANLDTAFTNPQKYITHVANSSDPCDTKCANPNCEKAGQAGVVCALHQGTACGQTNCPTCNEPFYGYKNNTYHVRKDGTNGNPCSPSCASCSAYRPLYWGHKYNSCSGSDKCIYCGSGAGAGERTHTYIENAESPKSKYTCAVDGCGYANPSLKLCAAGHTYTNRCDQKCDVCGVQGAKSYQGGSSLVPEYWHIYQNSCDTTCEDCGEVREITHTYPIAECGEFCKVCGEKRETTVPHTYSNVLDAELNPIENSSACDTICDACNEVREVPHMFVAKCSKKCLICRIDNPNIEHTYTDDCDSECDVVGCIGTREAPHKFDYVCDATCRTCGATNADAVDHIYGATCDTTCNRGCGFVRTGVIHAYDNAHDATCNTEGCDFIRTAETDSTFAPDHTYDNACDTTCNACGATRTIEHAYTNACDADCDVCGATRAPSAHVYGEDFEESADGTKVYTCTVCGYKNDSGEKAGLGGGAIAGIIAGSVAVLGGGGFSIYWFIFRKKRI